jgi:hypothetical protein
MKRTNENERLHKVTNDKGITVGNFATQPSQSQKYYFPTLQHS